MRIGTDKEKMDRQIKHINVSHPDTRRRIFQAYDPNGNTPCGPYFICPTVGLSAHKPFLRLQKQHAKEIYTQVRQDSSSSSKYVQRRFGCISGTRVITERQMSNPVLPKWRRSNPGAPDSASTGSGEYYEYITLEILAQTSL